MGLSSIAQNLGKIVTNTSRLTGKLEIGVNKVLWGVNNTQPTMTAAYDTVSGSFSYTSNIPASSTQVKGNLINSGLYSALDALNSVDLCNVLTYAVDTINLKKKPRPPKPWNASQTAFYNLQDRAALVQTYIDKYTAYPNEFIGSYLGTGPNAIPPALAASGSDAPIQGGTQEIGRAHV